MNKSLAEIFKDKYVIPLYQRSFSWHSEEILQLLQDIYNCANDGTKGNYYIGSIVVLKRHNGEYEVIDGQQRLTILSVIAKLVDKQSIPILSYDSRPEVNEFFNTLYNNGNIENLPAPSLYYLKEAVECIKNATIISPQDETSTGELYINLSKFVDFFWNKVIVVRTEMPEDTDVAAYFEIMNNRGEQLKKHEIVKSRMMESIKDESGQFDVDKQMRFGRIWDVCSQMDIPVHRLMTPKERIAFFGENYSVVKFPTITLDDQQEYNPSKDINNTTNVIKICNLKEIINELENGISKQNYDEMGNTERDNLEDEIYTYKSIIDFPNFLMHVLRLYQKINSIPVKEVPLNESELISAYNSLEETKNFNSLEFIKLLLFCRSAFDRFIVKTQPDSNDQDDGEKWVLISPKVSKKDNNRWHFAQTFDNETEKVIKALSMLQVTFQTRTYKNWLYETLVWLHETCCTNNDRWFSVYGDFSSITLDIYIEHIHRYINSYFNKQNYLITSLDFNNPNYVDSYTEGTKTPHFILNFVDYLLWLQDQRNGEYKFKRFSFKYWNSVEHHLAQNKVPEDCPYVDNLGNLCLVNKSTNSRLSDRDVKEKVQVYGDGNLGPNRQLIYRETKKDENTYIWKEKEIQYHYNEIVELLNKRDEILFKAK